MEEEIWKDIDDLVFDHNQSLTTTNSAFVGAIALHHSSLLDFSSTPATSPRDATLDQIPVDSSSSNLGSTFNYEEPNSQVELDIDNRCMPSTGAGALPSSTFNYEEPNSQVELDIDNRSKPSTGAGAGALPSSTFNYEEPNSQVELDIDNRSKPSTGAGALPYSTFNYEEPNSQLELDIDNRSKPSTGAGVLPSSCKKRPHHGEMESSDERHQRLARNRESSARSRAKKQARTDNLETELTSLEEENARLRRTLEKLHQAITTNLPERNMKLLHRTLTAPF